MNGRSERRLRQACSLPCFSFFTHRCCSHDAGQNADRGRPESLRINWQVRSPSEAGLPTGYLPIFGLQVRAPIEAGLCWCSCAQVRSPIEAGPCLLRCCMVGFMFVSGFCCRRSDRRLRQTRCGLVSVSKRLLASTVFA